MLPGYFLLGVEKMFLSEGKHFFGAGNGKRGWGRLLADWDYGGEEEGLSVSLLFRLKTMSYVLRGDVRSMSLGFYAMFLWNSPFIRIS